MTRLNADGSSSDAGNLSGADIKPMLKGFKFNGLFWENPKTKYIYTIE